MTDDTADPLRRKALIGTLGVAGAMMVSCDRNSSTKDSVMPDQKDKPEKSVKTAATPGKSSIPGKSVLVTDFGADPTGVTAVDDAFRQAIAAAAELINLRANQPMSGEIPSVSVLFPPGSYRFEKEIRFDKSVHQRSRWVSVQGMGGRVLFFSKTGDHNALHWEGANGNVISGIEFQNFRTCMSFVTNNISMATFSVSACRATHCDTFVDSVGHDESRSTLLSISHCALEVRQVVRSFCDALDISDCFVRSAFYDDKPNEAVFLVDSRARFSSCLLIPVSAGDKSHVMQPDARWVDFDNRESGVDTRALTFVDCRFSGESGGITPVWNWVMGSSFKGSKRNPMGISFLSCAIYTKSADKRTPSAAVVLKSDKEQTYAPNFIVFNGCAIRVPVSERWGAVVRDSNKPINLDDGVFVVDFDQASMQFALPWGKFPVVGKGLESRVSKTARSVIEG